MESGSTGAASPDQAVPLFRPSPGMLRSHADAAQARPGSHGLSPVTGRCDTGVPEGIPAGGRACTNSRRRLATRLGLQALREPDSLRRPDRLDEHEPPPVPKVDESHADQASVTYSRYRTSLSNHRTALSEHRTQLSEFRTDLSTHRTNLSMRRTEMSMRRTGMSLQRTRMSADRTLMSVMRTALSLIGFGFTIAQFFGKLVEAGTMRTAGAPRHFGLALVLLGIGMLAAGVFYHISFMVGLRNQRRSMRDSYLVFAQSHFPVSLTLIVSMLLLLIGLFALYVLLSSM